MTSYSQLVRRASLGLGKRLACLTMEMHSQLSPVGSPTPNPTPNPPAASRPGPVLTVLCAAAFMASLDVFIVNVAFTDISHSFRGSSLSDLSWILNGYAILYAALLVPLGRISDRYGRKPGFLAGLALFTAASAACALSGGLWMLVAFRALQAVGAAALTPSSLGLLLNATPAPGRARAVRIWAASGALASAAGPVLGGLLVEASWRWVFLVNVPVGLLALVAAVRWVPDSRDTSVRRTPDLLGAALLAVAIGTLALGLVKGPDWGWTSIGVTACLLVTVLGVAAFWRRSLHHPSPVVEPALLRVRAFAWSNVTALLFSLAFAVALLSQILWLQDVWGYTALRTGLAIAPGPLMVPLFATFGHQLRGRVHVGQLTALGCLAVAAGVAVLIASVGPDRSYAAEMLPGILLTGVGVGFALPTILSSATADLPPARAATGSAVVNMGRQIGSVIGISVLVVVLGTHTGYGPAHAAFQHIWWVVLGVCLLSAAAAFGMTPGRPVSAAQTNVDAVQPFPPDRGE